MTLSCKCGAEVAPGENFCGSCGAPQNHDDPPEVSQPAADADEIEVITEEHRGGVDYSENQPAKDGIAVTGFSSAGSGTGEIVQADSSPSLTSRADEAPGKRTKPKALSGGTVLNSRYQIVRLIGGGGRGAIYLATDRNLGDAARAVKEMIESHIDDTQHEKAIADFKRESLLLTELEHPSIPTVYDYFYDDGSERFYLVMKFIPGSDLSSRLRQAPGGRVDEPTVTEWGIQVADVLHYLHTRPQPIIYRDLKPANLMIDSNNNRIMLIDFGIARWVNKKEKG